MKAFFENSIFFFAQGLVRLFILPRNLLFKVTGKKKKDRLTPETRKSRLSNPLRSEVSLSAQLVGQEALLVFTGENK